jgi:hypothetical protein
MKSNLLAGAFLSVLLLAGCQSATQLNSIRIGMTKAEVVASMGQPDSTAAQANAEYFTYYLYVDSDRRDEPYLVRFVDGKVESFGRFAQLYDLYNRPVAGGPQGPNVGMNPVTLMGGGGVAPATVYTAAPSTAPDLATELRRLKALEDQGILTPAEFEQAKKKLLSDGH